MDVVVVAFDQTVDSWVATANRVLAAAGVVLLVATARSYRSAVYGTCLRSGAVHTSPTVRSRPELTPAPRRVRVTAYAGAAAFLPYVGAATLAPYGAVGTVYAALGTAGVVTVPPGDFPTSADALLVIWVGLGTFAAYGIALGVAAWSYLRRTRPTCTEVRA